MAETFDFLEWVMEHYGDGYALVRKDEDSIRLDAGAVYGEVNLYHFEMEVAELRLNRAEDDETIFFLHFELKDADHAKELYDEMIGVLRRQKEHHTVRILLSCTSAMTTSFFAGKLSEGAKTLSLDYEFAAVPFPSLYEKVYDYDVVLLAPQVAYEYEKVRRILRDKTVLLIPPALFATYDTGAVLEFVKEELAKAGSTVEETAVAKVMRDNIVNDKRIFIITVTHDLDRTDYGCRLYDHGEIVFSNRTIKEKNTLQDLYDIMDTRFVRLHHEKAIDCVAISHPYVVFDYSLGHRVWANMDAFVERMRKRYGVPVYVSNNANNVALGYYAGQDKYDCITYHSQPRGGIVGGQGIVSNGHLITGGHGFAGEIGDLYERYHPTDGPTDVHYHSPEEVLDAVSFFLIANIAMVDPQVILVRSDLTPDMDELRESIAKTMRKEDIPKLVYVRDVSEYAALGTMLFGLYELTH